MPAARGEGIRGGTVSSWMLSWGEKVRGEGEATSKEEERRFTN